MPDWNANYPDAARRHWRDAEHLRADGRLDNADQLLGVSAECALKAILIARGAATVDGRGDVGRPFRKHVDLLWPEVRDALQGRGGAELLARLPAGKPFGDWSVHQRYAATGAVDAQRLQRHRQAARATNAALEWARTGGTTP